MENGNSDSTETPEFLPGFPTVDHFNRGLFEKFVKATKTANALPKADEFKYFSTISTFRSHMDEFGQRILNLMQNFLTKEAGEKAPIINDFEDADEVSDNFEVITDVVDSLLEKVDSFSDEVKGALPKPSIVVAKVKTPPSTGKRVDLQVFAGSNIPRPQLKFDESVDNTNNPFIPKLKTKPNAIIPLEKSMNKDMLPKLSSDMESHISNLGLRPNDDQTPHPYEYEILSFQYLPSQLLFSKPQIYRSLEDTPLTFIKTSNQLYTLAKRLESEPEIAIDLESHSYRSFQGFTCLMQISTRTEDFLIDTIELRSHMQVLNTSFTNPKIVKILHGADSDITWLQRDFSLYIVNMFDTGQAKFPKFSLAYLLSHYCKINVDKKYQLADWRIRPIPEEMIKYAREDTHYLLYVYDLMKNELIQRGNQTNNLLIAVLNRSRDLCLKKYEKERLTETSHLILYNKFNWLFNPQQMRVFAAMYAWRDRISRSEDESTRYVLPNHMLSRISEVLPTDISGLYSCCNPVPPFVKLYSMEILSIISEAKKEPTAQVTPSYLPQYSTIPQAQARSVNISGNLANINTNANVHHTDGHSPVLTTEQLYETAGWVDSPFSRNSRAIFSTRQNNIQPIGMSFDSSSDDEDEDDLESKKTANLIHSSLTQELFSIPLQTFVVEPEEKIETIEPQHNPVEKVVKITEEVPKSISDIYKLSNHIKRKRSKDKQKKDEKMNEDESEDEGKTKKAKVPDRDASNSSEFMKEIGWIDKQEDAPLKGKNSNINQEQKQNSNKGNKQNAPSKEKPSKFTPFDYNSVQQTRTERTQNENQFNPYSKPQSPDFQKKGNQGNKNVKPQTGNRSLTFRPKGNSGNNNQNRPRK